MRVPFPLALSVGTDIVQLRRIWDPTKPDIAKLKHLVRRILHPTEIQHLHQRYPDWQSLDSQAPNRQAKICQWFGGRWAAKEAARKAWGATLVGAKDLKVEIRAKDEENPGHVQIVCAPEQLTGEERESVEQVAELSISHDGEYAIAIVVASPLHESIKAVLGERKAEAEGKVRRSSDSVS